MIFLKRLKFGFIGLLWFTFQVGAASSANFVRPISYTPEENRAIRSLAMQYVPSLGQLGLRHDCSAQDVDEALAKQKKLIGNKYNAQIKKIFPDYPTLTPDQKETADAVKAPFANEFLDLQSLATAIKEDYIPRREALLASLKKPQDTQISTQDLAKEKQVIDQAISRISLLEEFKLQPNFSENDLERSFNLLMQGRDKNSIQAKHLVLAKEQLLEYMKNINSLPLESRVKVLQSIYKHIALKSVDMYLGYLDELGLSANYSEQELDDAVNAKIEALSNDVVSRIQDFIPSYTADEKKQYSVSDIEKHTIIPSIQSLKEKYKYLVSTNFFDEMRYILDEEKEDLQVLEGMRVVLRSYLSLIKKLPEQDRVEIRRELDRKLRLARETDRFDFSSDQDDLESLSERFKVLATVSDPLLRLIGSRLDANSEQINRNFQATMQELRNSIKSWEPVKRVLPGINSQQNYDNAPKIEQEIAQKLIERMQKKIVNLAKVHDKLRTYKAVRDTLSKVPHNRVDLLSYKAMEDNVAKDALVQHFKQQAFGLVDENSKNIVNSLRLLNLPEDFTLQQLQDAYNQRKGTLVVAKNQASDKVLMSQQSAKDQANVVNLDQAYNMLRLYEARRGILSSIGRNKIQREREKIQLDTQLEGRRGNFVDLDEAHSAIE